MGKYVTYGIISPAFIAPRFCAGMQQTANGQVVAVSSRSIEKAEAFARDNGIARFYGDWREMLKDGGVDAVYIPLINSLHYPVALEALKAGKHVVLEKPFVLHGWQGRELLNEAQKRNLFVTEAVKTPYLPVMKELKKMIDDGRFGKLQYMTFRQSYTSGHYGKGWKKQKEYGGGALYANEAYFLTMAEYFGGGITGISGQGSYGVHDVDDQFAVTLKTENNVLAASMMSTNVLFENGMTLYLDKARIEVPDYWKSREAFIYQNNELIEKLEYPCQYEFQYELCHFNECILSGLTQSPVTPVTDSIHRIEMCEELYRQWESRR